MKKKIMFVFFIHILLILLNCGCTEKNNGGNNSGTRVNTFIMTAQDLHNDMVSISNNTSYSRLYNSLDDGDTLIVQDTISQVQYNATMDTTNITFLWVNTSLGSSGNDDVNKILLHFSTLDFQFEGNITEEYSFGDYVNVTLHIEHVTFSVNNFEYDLEIFEEQWINQEYFSEHVTNLSLFDQGFKPLPQTTIKLISKRQNAEGSSISYFTTNSNEILLGETAILSWKTMGADSVSIDKGIGTFDPVGNVTVSPTQTTTYTLTAHFTTYVIIGSNTATVKIKVSSGLPISISLKSVDWNDTTNTVTWEVTNVEGGPVTDSDIDMFVVDENDHIANGQGIEHMPGLITQGSTFKVSVPLDGHYIFKITKKGFGDVYFQSDLTKY